MLGPRSFWDGYVQGRGEYVYVVFITERDGCGQIYQTGRGWVGYIRWYTREEGAGIPVGGYTREGARIPEDGVGIPKGVGHMREGEIGISGGRYTKEGGGVPEGVVIPGDR